LIESQRRQIVAPPKERKDAFGDLGHNQIVFEHCLASPVEEAMNTTKTKMSLRTRTVGA